MTMGFRAAPGGPPGRLGPERVWRAEEEEGPGVPFPAPVGVPDFVETGGVDLPESLGGLLDPGVEA